LVQRDEVGYATHKDRITKPMIRAKITDPWREVSWEEAINHAASHDTRLAALVGHHADDLVALHLGLEGAADAAIGAGRDLGIKGRFAYGYATHKDRITKPMIRAKITDPWREVSWEEAIKTRAQVSTLLLPKAARTSFWTR
jgi:predicted molibdopterin-dependent oxidoreductase YjgC